MKLHLMRDFGIVRGSTGEIRADRLEDRLDPLVPFPHRHSFYHLVYVTRGRGWHEIDFRRYAISPRQLFLMKPAQVHSWSMSRGTRGYVLEIEGDAVFRGQPDHLLLSGALQSSPDQIRLPEDSGIPALLENMVREYHAQGSHFEAILRHSASQLLIQLSRMDEESLAPPSSERDPLLGRFLSMVEENFYREHGVQFYADLLKTTSKALTMRVSRALGRSARAVIQDRCLLESKRLLAYSALDVGQIGRELGFEDPNYFSRFFRSRVRMSPGQFRKNARSLC